MANAALSPNRHTLPSLAKTCTPTPSTTARITGRLEPRQRCVHGAVAMAEMHKRNCRDEQHDIDERRPGGGGPGQHHADAGRDGDARDPHVVDANSPPVSLVHRW